MTVTSDNPTRIVKPLIIAGVAATLAHMHRRCLNHPLLGVTFFLIFGCSTLVGNVKPIDRKSKNYSYGTPAGWSALPSEPQDSTFSSERADLTLQGPRSGVFIAVNSACRDSESWKPSLPELADQWVQGLEPATPTSRQETLLQNRPALHSTHAGQLSGKSTYIETYILSESHCVYDLVFFGPQNDALALKPDFDRFIQGFRLD